MSAPVRSTPREQRRRRLAAAGVGLVAFAVQAIYALRAAPNILPVSDAGAYRLLGKHLAEGRGYIRPYDFAFDGITRPTAEFPPLFPALLGAFHGGGLTSVTAQRLGLAVVGGLTAVAMVVLARRWFSPRGAVAIGLVVAIHPAFVQPAAALLAESLYVLLIVAVVIAAVRLRERPLLERGLLLGLLGGAAMLVRSEGLLVAAVVAGPMLVAPRRDPDDVRRLRGMVLVGLLLGLAALPGAWAWRNSQRFERPVVASNNASSVVAGSYCDATFDGEHVGFWLISDDCFAGFTAAGLASTDESVAAHRLRDDGVRYAREHLVDLPRVAWFRVLRALQLYEPERQARLATFEGRRLGTERLGGWVAWATYPLAIAGVVSLSRRRLWSTLWILTAPTLVVIGTIALTYGNARFRIGAEPSLLLLAAFGVRSAWWRLRTHRSPKPPASENSVEDLAAVLDDLSDEARA